MMKRLVPVDEQISQFEDVLSHQLGVQLLHTINIPYWQELDELDQNSLQRINDTIQVAFDHLLPVYSRSRVGDVLRSGATLMKSAARLGLNVPCPVDLPRQVMHVGQVGQNLFEFYIENIYSILRTEMVMLNHSAHVIQRNWMKAATWPEHPICRRRLVREFENLIENTQVV